MLKSVDDILKASISSSIDSAGASPVTAYIAKLANQLESATVQSASVKSLLGKGKTHFETATVLPDKSIVTKFLHFNFEGTIEEFNKGLGTMCQATISIDNKPHAKLLLLESTMVEKMSTATFPVTLKIHGQPTNTEVLYSNKLGRPMQRRSNDDEDSDSYVSAIIQGCTPFITPTEVLIYDRKHDVDFEELEHWIGFNFDDLNKDILDIPVGDGICIVRHSNEQPSPIVMVLEHNVKTGQIEPFDNEPCTHDGLDACIMRLSNVKWALEHIKGAYEITPFTNFEEIKATIEPLTQTGTWTSSAKPMKKNGILNAFDNLSQEKPIRVGAVVKNSYIVCNNVVNELASAINSLNQ